MNSNVEKLVKSNSRRVTKLRRCEKRKEPVSNLTYIDKLNNGAELSYFSVQCFQKTVSSSSVIAY